jgi:hypothetical protein
MSRKAHRRIILDDFVACHPVHNGDRQAITGTPRTHRRGSNAWDGNPCPPSWPMMWRADVAGDSWQRLGHLRPSCPTLCGWADTPSP